MDKSNLRKVMLVTFIFVLAINIAIVFKAKSQQEISSNEEQKIGQGEVIETKEGKLDISFKDADIRNVLRLISEKSGINIIAGEEVTGTITVSLKDVNWDDALKAILNAYDCGYEREGNIITVMSLERLSVKSKTESELGEVQPIISEVFRLRYLDATDVAKAIDRMLSSRGSVAVVQMRGQLGWKFGDESLTKREREEVMTDSRSKVLLVSDISSYIDKIKDVISKVDTKPKQVLIEAKIIEVNHDKLKDIGFDWGTGPTGAENSALEYIDLNKGNNKKFGAHMMGDQNTPSIFNPETSGLDSSDTGLKLSFKKLSGAEFEVILHALAEDVEANILSAPRIMTLDNQEATIMIGTKYPILKANVSGTDQTTTTTTLDYYQDIGIQLNVVPQICDEGHINMIVHPAVTSYTSTLQAKSSGGTVLAEYPIIITREAETQVLLEDKETIVIGGLLKDVKSKGTTKVPLLGDIPLLGKLFRRDTTDAEKVDLLIFINAKILEEASLTEKELSLLDKYKK